MLPAGNEMVTPSGAIMCHIARLPDGVSEVESGAGVCAASGIEDGGGSGAGVSAGAGASFDVAAGSGAGIGAGSGTGGVSDAGIGANAGVSFGFSAGFGAGCGAVDAFEAKGGSVAGAGVGAFASFGLAVGFGAGGAGGRVTLLLVPLDGDGGTLRALAARARDRSGAASTRSARLGGSSPAVSCVLRPVPRLAGDRCRGSSPWGRWHLRRSRRLPDHGRVGGVGFLDRGRIAGILKSGKF